MRLKSREKPYLCTGGAYRLTLSGLFSIILSSLEREKTREKERSLLPLPRLPRRGLVGEREKETEREREREKRAKGKREGSETSRVCHAPHGLLINPEFRWELFVN